MKKTLTVNLGGRVFHIDEDAYQLLDKYLSNLRVHFSKEEGSDEILDDFENRISELFGERVRLGYDVITLTHVEDVIKRMGKPEEIFGEDFEKEEEKQKEHQQSKSTTERIRESVSRRLFRNPDDRILGGVASGVSAYMGWDTSVVRLLWFLLMFFYGVAIPVYFVLWLVVPMAHTATEKLQMRGEVINLENIGKTVTDGFDKVSGKVNDYVNQGQARSIFGKFADLVVEVLGVILKIFAVLFAVIFAPVLLLVMFILLVVFGSLIFGGFNLLYRFAPTVPWEYISDYPSGLLVTGSLCMILMIGIPLVAVIYSLISYFFKFKPVNNGLKWTLVILWVISLMVNLYLGYHYGFDGMNIFTAPYVIY